MLGQSCFPSCWKSSLVVPVFKNDGERSDPGKCHPTSLLPIISKIFESFINDSLTKHLHTTILRPSVWNNIFVRENKPGTCNRFRNSMNNYRILGSYKLNSENTSVSHHLITIINSKRKNGIHLKHYR